MPKDYQAIYPLVHWHIAQTSLCECGSIECMKQWCYHITLVILNYPEELPGHGWQAFFGHN